MHQPPEPGRLVSLGEEQDRADAVALIGVVVAWGARPRRLLRYAVTYGFEYPRYPRPLVLRGEKLSAAWPWSPGARLEAERAAAAARPTRPVGLVQEHVQPIEAVVEALAADETLRDPERLVSFLFDSLRYAVITKAEDELLAVSDRAPRPAVDGDPWSRYRAAGLDVDAFLPLAQARPHSARRVLGRSDGATCTAADCDRPLYSNGLCSMHHGRYWNHGEDRPTCLVDGCERKQSSRGVCATHFARARAQLWSPGKGPFEGDVLVALAADAPLPPLDGPKPRPEPQLLAGGGPRCQVEGCNRALEARGVCAAHFARSKALGLWTRGRGPFTAEVLADLAREADTGPAADPVGRIFLGPTESP